MILLCTPILLLLCALALWRRKASWYEAIALAGLAATMYGDWHLAVKCAPVKSAGFIQGVTGFAVAHLCWTVALMRHGRPDSRVFVGLILPLAAFLGIRVLPTIPAVTFCAVCTYTVITALSVSTAIGTRRVLWIGGTGMLMFSDLMIAAGSFLHIRPLGGLVVPTYVLSLLLIASAIAAGERCLLRLENYSERTATISCLLPAVVCFCWAMVVEPTPQPYNPLMRMLSYLGRTEIAGVEYPLCFYLFTAGMLFSAAAVGVGCFYLLPPKMMPKRRLVVSWGGAISAAGLAMIGFVPENVNGFCHNMGCHLAAIGGAMMVFTLNARRGRWWIVYFVMLCALFNAFIILDRCDVLPFAPYVPTLQKALIVSYVLWFLLGHGRVEEADA